MSALPDWTDDLLKRLNSFLDLAPNWDSYRAKAADPDSVRHARSVIYLVAAIEGMNRPLLSLSPAGNVSFTWRFMTGDVDVEILGSGLMRMSEDVIDGESVDLEDPVDIAYLIGRLNCREKE